MAEPNREPGSFYELSTELLFAAFPDASIDWVAAQASTAAERVYAALGTTPLVPESGKDRTQVMVAEFGARRDRAAQEETDLSDALNAEIGTRYAPRDASVGHHMRPTIMQRERMRQMASQRLVWRLQEILVGVGLTQPDSSLAGGRTLHIPEVISVAEKPMRFTIRTLPGQIPDDFVKAAPRIADMLDVAEVHVDRLGPSLIELRLVPKIRRSGG